MSKLTLGTAQFGFDYGISNSSGQVVPKNVENILAAAEEANIHTLDSATSYGVAETVLGSIGINRFKVITKINLTNNLYPNLQAEVINQVSNSLRRLNINQFEAVLLHNTHELDRDFVNRVMLEFNFLKSQKLTKKIGISIYNPKDLSKVADLSALDVVQSPLNLLDQRIISDEWRLDLAENQVELHARSIFLQGLLLLPLNKIQRLFPKYEAFWTEFFRCASDNNINMLQACLEYALSFDCVSSLVIGVQSTKQLKELIELSSVKLKNYSALEKFSSNNENIINPSRWTF